MPNVARSYLDQLAKRFEKKEYLFSDPVQFLHRYKDPWDQEAIGLIAAVLAYGKAQIVIRSVEKVVSIMDETSKSPREFIQALQKKEFRTLAEKKFRNFRHRFNVGQDIVGLLFLLSESWKNHGSLLAHLYFFQSKENSSLEYCFSQVIQEWKKNLTQKKEFQFKKSIYYFLTDPQDGSTCKRWCMYFKWMIRKTHPDLGTWTLKNALSSAVSHSWTAADLVLPIDTHVGRLSLYMGLTTLKTANWKFAIQVTEGFKKINLQDPTKYDFALSRLGILNYCKKEYRKEICTKCEIFPLCQYAQKQKERAS